MADFCKQCSIKLFGQDFGDLTGLCKDGEKVAALCEGCGPVFVDSTGTRVSEPWQPKRGKVKKISAKKIRKKHGFKDLTSEQEQENLDRFLEDLD